MTLFAFCLLTACSQSDYWDQKDLEALNNCSMDGFVYIINSSLSEHYNTIFEQKFSAIKAQSFFDRFSLSENMCELSNGKKIVTFVYLSKGDKHLSQISRGIHTLFVLFDSKDNPLKSTDVTCPFADDIGGISETILENNYLYGECRTQGSYGFLSGHIYGASEMHRINLLNFQNEIVWQQEWDREKGDLKIISENYFVSESELSDVIKTRILKLSKKP